MSDSHCLSRLLLRTAGLILLLAGCAEQPDTRTGETRSPHEPYYQTHFVLGDEATLTTLYSYPNSDSGETLEATIEHYLNQRLSRDRIDGEADVLVDRGQYSVLITGDSEAVSDYGLQIPAFLNNGLLAAQAVSELKNTGQWNVQEWRFFLPLGLSIINQRSVQLLHFPPDYSLSGQDYLGSKTSQRWQQLLQLNGVNRDATTLYESILDIAPVAAPASAGGSLSDTYREFEPYVVSMLPLLLKADESASTALPIVAYGGPVRDWVASHYQLGDFGVNTVARIAVTEQASAPILGANHPSYIWYAKDQGRAAATAVMLEDLISACWQARMGNNPQQTGKQVLASCRSDWQAQPETVCIQTEIQAFDKSAAEAGALCQQTDPEIKSPSPGL